MTDILIKNPTHLSFKIRLLLIFSTILIYIIILSSSYPLFERASLIFAFMPILLSAYLFGRMGGLFSSMLTIPVNMILLILIEQSAISDFMLTNYWATHIAFIIIGVIVGYMQELRWRLLSELMQGERIKQELYLSEQRYSLLVKNFPNSSIMVYDHDLRFVLVDGPEMKRSGFSKEMMEGKTLNETFPPEYVQMFEPNMRAALAGQLFEAELPWEDNQYYLYTYVPLKDEENKIIMAMILAQNISERKQTLNQLKQSEIRYRALFEQSHHAVFILDLDSRYLEVNQVALDKLGYTSDEIINLSNMAIVIPLEHPESKDVHEKLLQGEKLPSYERTLRRKDGTEFPVELNVALVRDEAGNPLHIQSIALDISERKQAINQLKQSELRYRALFEQSNDAVFIMDPNGVHLEVNDAAAEMLGYTIGELLDLSFKETVVATEHSKTTNVIKRLLAGERIPIYERILQKKDGIQFFVEINIELVRDEAGNPLHIQSIVRDISTRRQTLSQLEQSELRYRALFQQSNDAVFILSLEGGHLEANDAATEMLGYTPDEIINLSFREIVVPTEHSESENILEILQTGKHLPIYERIFRKKDGTIFPVEINVDLVRDETGNPLHIQSIARDISERKKEQEQELSYALEIQKTQLLTKLISDLSHDLRTPLSIIKTAVYLLGKLKEPKQQSDKLEIITQQVNHLGKVIEDMLTISRLEGLNSPSFRSMKLDSLVHELATKYHTKAQEKSIRFELQLEDGLPSVLGDKSTLYLALGGLVENALNYTSKGGHIIFKIHTEEEYIVLNLEDTGDGISKEDIPYIFDYFFRGDNARSLKTGGAGLGLSIAKKAIEVHGGFIEVESTLGQGTTFQIKLPRLDKIGIS